MARFAKEPSPQHTFRAPGQPHAPASHSIPPTIEFTAQRGLPEQIDYLNLLWRKKWWIVGALLLGAIGGTVRVVTQPPIYPAFTTIELLGINETFMGLSQIDPQAYSLNATNIQTQTRILTSTSLINRVVERVNLELPPVTPPSPDIFGKIRNRIGVLSPEPVELTRAAVQMAADSLRARGVGASRLVEISCESISPEIASSFVNAVAAEYVSQYSQLRSTNNARTTQWMEGQLEEAKNRVEQADNKLREFSRRTGSVYFGEQNTLADTKLRQLQNDLSSIQAERLTKQSKYELVKSTPGDNLAVMFDDAYLRSLRDKLSDLRREKAQLLTTLTPAHVKVQRVEDQINDVDQTFQKEKAAFVKRVQGEYDSALRRERLLMNAYSSEMGAVSSQTDKASEYAMLKRESDAARQIYNLLLQQVNQAAVVTAVPTTNVRVIDPAFPARFPSRPLPARDIFFGGMLAMFFAGGIAVLRENVRARKLSKVFATPGHSANMLDVPELGVIPSLQPGMWRHKIPAGHPVNAHRSGRLLGPRSERQANELIVWQQKPSFAAESFRFTLTSVFGPDALQKMLLIVTSPGPGEGKTTLVSNLAIATVETGRRVLLIDADFRKPRLHSVFHLSEGPGFKDMIRSKTPVEELDLSSFIQPTSIPDLSLLPSGEGRAESAAPLLFSSRLPALLSRLREEFDVILIDTVPAMQFADARLLGRLSDGVILVVRSGVTFRDNAMSTRLRFLSDRIPILGTILNDWTAPEGTKDYYGDKIS